MAPVEDLFGGGSRTRHVILKRRSASLSQSAFSCPVFEKVAPNRDYPYEGLFAMVGLDYWKFIDMIALGVQSSGRQLKLTPAEVKATPWSCEYSYEADGLTVRATYYLYKVNNGASGYMDVIMEGPDARSSTIIFEPYFDIRFMYDRSAPDNIRTDVSDDILTATVGGPTVCLSSAGARYVQKGRQIEWRYKLGSGYRYREDDHIRFMPEKRAIASFYDIQVDGPAATLRFSCGPDRDTALKLQGTPVVNDDVAEADSLRRVLFPNFGQDQRDILYRALGMCHFGTTVNGAVFQEAGDFWFRSVWFRDEFEGLIHNYQTIRKVYGTDGIKLAKQFQPNIVLMDINMPGGVDGISASETISKDVPTAAIIMMSVQSGSDYLRRSMLAGARDFLTKPFTSDELVSTIRRVHDMNRGRV
jgi:CheY-like chemotaxis protein